MKITAKSGPSACVTANAYGRSKSIGRYAAARAVHKLAAMGAVNYQAQFHVISPASAGKSKINAVKRIIRQVCQEQNISLEQITQETNPSVALPVVTVCAAGEIPAGGDCEIEGRPVPGQDLVLTKWAGMEGMLCIAAEKAQELRGVFAPAFLRQMKEFEAELFDTKQTEAARRFGGTFLYPVTEGGVFSALWDLAEECQCGMDLDMKAISIRQETVEVCEQYRLNPYQLTSAGCLLIAADDGAALAEQLESEGIRASVLGKFTDNNDKIIHNGGEIRYIDRPAPDEFGKIFM